MTGQATAKTVGIIGAGQLGQMLGFAGADLGLNCVFLDPADRPPAAACGPVIQAAYDDPDALAALAGQCDVVTYEFENVEVAAIRQIESICKVCPPPAALSQAQDRLIEKKLFESVQIPLPGYRRIDSQRQLQTAMQKLGLPLVLKTRRFGYDGKGQAVLRSTRDAAAAFSGLGGHDLIAEQFVPFERELSAIAARDRGGAIVCYPLAENRHSDGILRVSRAADCTDILAPVARRYIERLLLELDYVGVLALEMFVVGERLLANEFAPRVHNSGHWTIEGTDASQFENHMRAITGMPLIDATMIGYPGMVNIIGSMPQTDRSLLAVDAKLHDYGKQPRPGRKLGHATIVGRSPEDRDKRLAELESAVAEAQI